MQIIQFNLLSQESLSKQTRANRILALDLLHFISQHQVSGKQLSSSLMICLLIYLAGHSILPGRIGQQLSLFWCHLLIGYSHANQKPFVYEWYLNKFWFIGYSFISPQTQQVQFNYYISLHIFFLIIQAFPTCRLYNNAQCLVSCMETGDEPSEEKNLQEFVIQSQLFLSMMI